MVKHHRHSLRDSMEMETEFLKFPKFLFSEEFQGLNSDSRLLYAILRDRHSLSVKNNWVDDMGNIYMYCGREEMCKLLNVSRPTVVKAFNLLAKHHLIEEERQGMGKPNKIYLLTFTSSSKEVLHNDVKDTYDSSKEVLLTDVKNTYNKGKETLLTDVKNLDPNNTNIKQIDNSKTDKSNTLKARVDYNHIVDCYNNICLSLPKVSSLTEQRKKGIRRLLKCFEANNHDIVTFFNTVEASDFLTGRSGDWTANFDWIIKESNYIKIVEGNYVNKSQNKETSKTNHTQYMEILEELGELI